MTFAVTPQPLGDCVAEVDVEADHLARLGVGRRERWHVREGAAAELLAGHDVRELVGAGRGSGKECDSAIVQG